MNKVLTFLVFLIPFISFAQWVPKQNSFSYPAIKARDSLIANVLIVNGDTIPGSIGLQKVLNNKDTAINKNITLRDTSGGTVRLYLYSHSGLSSIRLQSDSGDATYKASAVYVNKSGDLIMQNAKPNFEFEVNLTQLSDSNTFNAFIVSPKDTGNSALFKFNGNFIDGNDDTLTNGQTLISDGTQMIGKTIYDRIQIDSLKPPDMILSTNDRFSFQVTDYKVNSTAIRNQGFGTGANKYSSGDYISGFGYGTNSNSSGDYISGFGYRANYGATGDYISGFGYRANYGATGDNLISIGFQAGQNDTTDNQLKIEMQNLSSTPLIHGDFLKEELYLPTIQFKQNLIDANDSSFSSGQVPMSDGTQINARSVYTKSQTDTLINFNNVFQASPQVSIINTPNYRIIDYNNYFEFDAGQGMWLSADDYSTNLELNPTSWSLYNSSGPGLNTYNPNQISVQPSSGAFEGIVYSQDHSSNYVDRSLVDKAYTLSVNNTGNVVTKSADYVSTGDDFLILGNTSSQSVTIQLHTPTKNQILNIKKAATDNSLIIQANTGANIDGNSSITLANQYDNITIIWNGTNWNIL